MNQVNGNGTVLRIGELAQMLQTTTKTLRHYEKMGLIQPSGRTASDYRVYDKDDQKRARNVFGLRALGLSIPEVRELLLGGSDTQSIRQRLLGYLDEKLRDVDETLVIMQGRRDDLSARAMALFETPRDRNKNCICNALLQKCDCINGK